MFRAVSSFEWSAPEKGHGFMWAKCSLVGAKTTFFGLVPAPNATFRSYRPLTEPRALYRLFASTKPDREHVLAFANQFGLLDCDSAPGMGCLARIVPGQGVRASTRYVVSFGLWRTYIGQLAEAVELWEMCQNNDLDSLAKVVRWQSGRVYLKWQSGRPYADFPCIGIDVAELPSCRYCSKPFRREDFVAPALAFVAEFLSQLLRTTRCSPALVWDGKAVRLIDEPVNLLGAIALQFALAVYGKRVARRCLVCGRPFDLAPGHNRADRRTCSSACRTRACRARKWTKGQA